MSAIRLAVIGAGSAEFSAGVIRDICVRSSLAGSRVMLMDIDERRLAVIHRFATRYAAELGADVTFEKTPDRLQALSGDDFVINTAQVGGHSTVEKVRSFCEERGYYRGLDFPMMAIQTRMMLSVARDMESACPRAWLLQCSNPLPEGCTAMTRHTGIKVCGLCHGHFGYQHIAGTLGLPPEKVRAQMIGLNHLIYLTHFECDGQDAYPLLDRWIAEKAPQYWAAPQTNYMENQLSPAAIEQYQRLGLMPIGDTPRVGGWWFHTDLGAKQRWYGRPWAGFDSELGWAEYLRLCRRKVQEIENAALNDSARLTELYPPRPTWEQHFQLIEALHNDKVVELQVNVPNRGTIEGIPGDVVAEMPSICSRRGIQPLHVGALPPAIMLNEIWPRILQMERVIELALHPSREMMLTMVLQDHRTRDYDQAVGMLNDLATLPELAELFGGK